MRRLLSCWCILLTAVAPAIAQSGTGMTGTITDVTGAVVVGAQVTATNLRTGSTMSAYTDSAGVYLLQKLNPGSYRVVIAKPGFQAVKVASVAVANGQLLTESTALPVSSANAMVSVSAGLPGATEQPTQEAVFESSQQLRVLDRKQIDTAGPVAGAAQIVALTPGANVTGYGNTGATKYTVGVNGVSQGWGGYGGYSGGGALAITLDGVPIVDPATDLWQSPTIPQQFLVQNVNVTYGPGDPAERWFNNVGGGIEFSPVQPSSRAHADVSATYGSFSQKNIAANLTSGIFHGWSGVLAGGVGNGNDFRHASDGFQNPGKDLAIFAKGIKVYRDDTFEIGTYYAHGAGFRSQVIPVVANPLITVDGTPTGAQYSQQTSGYYSTLPQLSYNKYDTNEDGLIYGRENIQLDPSLSLQNLTWWNHIARSHYRTADVYSPGAQLFEWNSPYTDAVGNRLLVTKRLPLNTITVGGYFIHALYNSRNNFYNPADGGAKRIANIGGKVRSSYFNQNDFAITVQDAVRFNSIVTITPGIRYVGFGTGYSNNSLQDFKLANGAVLTTHCPATQTGYSSPVDANGNSVAVKDQGASCDNLENRSGIEPSVSGTVRILPWLQAYGGVMQSLRSPQVGGGGGLFQSVDPASYHLSRQTYYQGGFKIHHEGTGVLNSMLITAALYHENWANQEIDTTLANGDSVAANGSSIYKGFNASFDDDPIERLHLFANANIETATYSNYETVVPAGSATPAQRFDGLHVPYVPNSTVNAGAFYDYPITTDLHIRPMLSFQYIGSQYIFNNNGVDSAGNSFPQPSNQKMSSYATLNAGVTAPYKFLEFSFNAQNLTNSKYLIYEFISSGGYFGTAGNGPASEGSGYILAYPGAPISVYGGVTAHF